MRHNQALQGLELQKIDQEQIIPDEEREDDFNNLIAILIGKIQLKRVEPGILARMEQMDQYYDLLPFNVRGLRLINFASLLEGNFIEKYIIKQTQDLNLELDQDFRHHYFIKAAVEMSQGVAAWSFFVSLILLTLFMLQLSLDSMLYNLLQSKITDVQTELNNTTGPTAIDEQTQHNLSEEILAIYFLYVLLPLRLCIWFIDLVLRFIGLRYFRKTYTTWTMLFDFILAILTIMIVGFSTRLDLSLQVSTAQTQVELILRNLFIFLSMLFGMIQSKKAMDVIKRLCILFSQKEVSCCNFISF